MTIEKLNDLQGYSLKDNPTLVSSFLLLKIITLKGFLLHYYYIIITLKGFHFVQVFLAIPQSLPLRYSVFQFF